MLWIKWTWKRLRVLSRLLNKILHRWELEEYITSVTISRKQSLARRMKGSVSSTSISLKNVFSTRGTQNNCWVIIFAKKVHYKQMNLQSLKDIRLFMMNKKAHNFAWWTTKLLSKDIHKFAQKISQRYVRRKIHSKIRVSETYLMQMNRDNQYSMNKRDKIVLTMLIQNQLKAYCLWTNLLQKTRMALGWECRTWSWVDKLAWTSLNL